MYVTTERINAFERWRVQFVTEVIFHAYNFNISLARKFLPSLPEYGNNLNIFCTFVGMMGFIFSFLAVT
jgi:hypothetical protein